METKGVLTRRNIVKQSLQLFSVKGYYNTSINDILEATNLTKGGLYGHFKSKEDIWYAVYKEAAAIWKDIIFKDMWEMRDPIARIEKVIENNMKNYLAAHVFEGGCFFLNMLVELSGQSAPMCRHILRGYVRFSRIMRDWLKEAAALGIIRNGLNFRDVSSFIVISLNGASALYTSSRDPQIPKQTMTQLKFYIQQLKK